MSHESATIQAARDHTTGRLTVTLRLLGALFVAFFGLAFTVVASEVPVEGTLAELTRWGHDGSAYELMITSIYVVWGAFLWRAAKDPLQNRSFLDFTLVANAVHFSVMFAAGVLVDGEHLHLVGDVLVGWIAVLALAAVWLPARRHAR